MRNVLAKVGKGHTEMVAATVRTIFAHPRPRRGPRPGRPGADMLAGQFPAVAEMLLAAKVDLTAFADFPQAHWAQELVHQPTRYLEPDRTAQP